MKPTTYQQALARSGSRYVVARWGRRTGKDAIVKVILNDNDLLVYPVSMRGFYTKEYRGLNIIPDISVREESLIGTTFKRVFIMEAAYTSGLYRLLEHFESRPVDQIFIISTPHLQRGITSSGFLFDAICARLTLTPVSDYSYTKVGYLESPLANADVSDVFKAYAPESFEEELEGGWKNV